jgi:O-antigen/teichoic acid export membrane protein
MPGPIARSTIHTSAVLGLRLAVQAGSLLLLARLFDPDQFGTFAGVTALAVMLGSLSTFGTHLVLLGEVAKNPVRREHVMSYAVPTTLLCGGVLFTIYLLACLLVLKGADVPLPVLVAVGITEMWLQPLFSLPAAEHLALERTARSQLLTTLPLGLRLLAAAIALLLHPTNPMTVYGYGYITASVAALAFASMMMPTPWPSLRTWKLPDRAVLHQASGYAALAITAASPTELDKTLATRLLPPTASGLYAASARAIGAATLPVIAMLLSALPRLFREGIDQPRRTSRLIRLIFAAALAYSILLAALLWMVAPVFAWLFGTRYGGIQHMIHWLCLAVPGMVLRMAIGNVLMALGKPWMRVCFEVSGLVVLLLAAVMLTAQYGEIGMPLALACSEWAMTLAGFALLLQVHPRNMAAVTTDKADE